MATFTQTATETYENAQGVPNEKTATPSAPKSNKIHSRFAPNKNAPRRKSFSDFRMPGDPDENPSNNKGEFHDPNNLPHEPPNQPRLTRHKEVKVPDPDKFNSSPRKLDQFTQQAATIFYFRYL
ncbi:hypothetical protein H072_11650 [Dactylellina haptotyla CBS 200.50]|uniref:Uncharacterized protein n=1 Tax=Dactylellina haptotyla (strain CBS 200.50) TaxID=1284197 RepID=S8B7S1_DACHA|nr:hypothetical protein H072_11650 [Dactylellina haptotyla CBS 200.50]